MCPCVWTVGAPRFLKCPNVSGIFYQGACMERSTPMIPWLGWHACMFWEILFGNIISVANVCDREKGKSNKWRKRYKINFMKWVFHQRDVFRYVFGVHTSTITRKQNKQEKKKKRMFSILQRKLSNKAFRI